MCGYAHPSRCARAHPAPEALRARAARRTLRCSPCRSCILPPSSTPRARLADDVEVGPYSIIGEHVEIGPGTRVGPHVVIIGHTRIGRNNRVFQFASLGDVPQDKKYTGEPTRLEIGDNNTIRECCTLNVGTSLDFGVTRLGDDNWIMAYTHIAHDCQVGSHTVLANSVQLAGHVVIGDFAILGGGTLVHQFCRIGAHAFTAGGSVVLRDVPPYVMSGGNSAQPHGLNSEGLKRRGFTAAGGGCAAARLQDGVPLGTVPGGSPGAGCGAGTGIPRGRGAGRVPRHHDAWHHSLTLLTASPHSHLCGAHQRNDRSIERNWTWLAEKAESSMRFSRTLLASPSGGQPVSTGTPVRIAMVAGEASGDALGAHLIEALSAALPGARFLGIGGPKMQAAGFQAWYPAETLAVGGYVEVLRHLPEILRVRRELLRRLLADPPDLFVGVDAPDFNLGLEEKLRARGIRTAQYVAPQVWAWRSHRVHQLRRAVDRVLSSVPVRSSAARAGRRAGQLRGTSAGRPGAGGARPARRPRAIPPVQRPHRGGAAPRQPGAARWSPWASCSSAPPSSSTGRCVTCTSWCPLLSRPTRGLFEQTLYRLEAQDLPLTILFGHAHMAMTAADSVLLASGTASLEAALLKRPMVVTYRLSPMTYALIKRRGYRLPYVSLPNILAGRFVVPEILQDDATPENLAQAVVNQLGDKVVRQRQERVFLELHRALRQNTRDKAVEAIVPLLSRADRPGQLAGVGTGACAARAR